MAQDNPPRAGDTVLDQGFVQRFLDECVTPFRKTLASLLDDDIEGAGPTLTTMLNGVNPQHGHTLPLTLGLMSNPLNGLVRRFAEDLRTLLEDDRTLFLEIESAIQETIDRLITTQQSNLTSIESMDFLDLFEDVESSLTGPAPSGGSGGSSGGSGGSA